MTADPDDAPRAPDRMAAVQQVRHLSDAAREAFDRLAGLAATVLDTPIALVNLIAIDAQFAAGAFGLSGTSDTAREVPIGRALSALVVERGEPLLIGDARADPRFCDHPAGASLDVIAYAGTPIHDAEGHAVGTLCAVDLTPRTWTDRDRAALDAVARSVTTEVTLYQHLDRRDRLLDALDTAPVAVAVTRGPDHVLAYVNRTYRSTFGDRPTGIPARQAFPELDQQGFLALMDRALATGDSRRIDEAPLSYHLGDADQQRYFDVSCSAIGTDIGEPYGLLVVAADVTDQAHARRDAEARAVREEAAVRAIAAVSRSLDPQTELDSLARSVVPVLADMCTVYQLDGPVPVGQSPPLPVPTSEVTAAGVGGTDIPPPRQAGILWPGGDVVTDAIAAGRLVRTTFDPAALPAWTESTGMAPVMRSAGVHTMVCVPVVTGGLVVAVVAFTAFRDRPPYTAEDLEVLQQIGTRANVAVGHGMAYQRTRDTALALQRSMLTDPPEVPGLALAACYRPAGEDTEVGGDWYDAFELPGGDLAVVIGDVAGHDMSAAATMGQLRSMLRALAVDTDLEPDDVLARLDRLATGMRVTSFTTLVYGRIRSTGATPVLRWANAGHPPPLLLDRSGQGRLLAEADGLVIGVRPDGERRMAEVVLPAGSTLLLYTDGLTERREGQEDDDVIERATALPDQPLGELCDKLLAGAPPYDDVALLAVRVDG